MTEAMMKYAARSFGLALFGAIALGATEARAQQIPGFALDQFDPSERGSDWFALESLDLRGNLRPAIGIVGDYSYRPLAIYNADGSVRSNIVGDQFFLHVGASLVLLNRLRFGLNVPVAIYQDGQGGTYAGVTYPQPSAQAMGDVRLGVDLRLVGEYGDPFTLGLGVQVYFPTGSQTNYTGDGSVRLQPRLMAAGDISIFAYAVRFGFEYRELSGDFANSPVGSELTYGASAGLRFLDHRLLIGPEVDGAATVSDSSQIFATRTTPLEGILGAHSTIADDWKIGLGGGAGLTRGYGSPTARGMAVIEWAPAVKKPPSDRDGDGIPDTEDACPDERGVRTDDPKTNGCPPPPPPPDRDGDGIPDSQDACPEQSGVKTDNPTTNGCPPPPPDRDKDGVPDADDACPDVAGVKTADPKTNGCPPPPPDPDRDKDGIPNEQDACPDEAGPKNADPKKNGCPEAIVKNNQIVILDQVKFATGSARILPASNGVLTAVLTILKDHPEIKKVSIEGHTDNKGAAALNKRLSASRAASVVAWLTTKGIAKQRLSSIGYGMERPIDTNETDEGRQENRRVEFHIVEQEGATPAPTPTPTP
ncbi:MAG: OmpA family protein [Polyangiaceae bacterium]